MLLKIEENVSPSSRFTSNDLICEEYDGETIAYHLRLLLDKGYVDVRELNFLGQDYPSYIIHRITMQGHDFLDNIRNDNVWSSTKEEVQKSGFKTVAINVISEIASKYTKKMFNLE